MGKFTRTTKPKGKIYIKFGNIPSDKTVRLFAKIVDDIKEGDHNGHKTTVVDVLNRKLRTREKRFKKLDRR